MDVVANSKGLWDECGNINQKNFLWRNVIGLNSHSRDKTTLGLTLCGVFLHRLGFSVFSNIQESLIVSRCFLVERGKNIHTGGVRRRETETKRRETET